MTKKFFIICTCSILATFAAGFEIAMIANGHDEFNRRAQAIPLIRFERFDESRNALIIGLFNPGTLSMEINRTELLYQTDNKIPRVAFNPQEYGEKPLVLDPGDTILIPLQKSMLVKSQAKAGSYWGVLDFRIPGQADFYSVSHRFSHAESK